MAFPNASLLKTPSALEQMLEEINFQRTKEMRQLLKDDSGFVVLQGSSYWTDLFVRHFLFQAEHCIDADDLLFFIRKKHIKGSSRYLPKYETEVEVYRKDSRKLPIGDPELDWEETVYLNLIIHQFDYTLTLAICTRTSPKQLQVLRRHSQKVYASPSRRRMDTKGEVEEMTYPNVCFMVDNFNEDLIEMRAMSNVQVFCDIMVRDGEMVCVELVASDRCANIQAVIFLGSIRYDALKRVYDARVGDAHHQFGQVLCAIDMWDSDWDEDPEDFYIYRHQASVSSKMAQRMTFGLFSSQAAQRVEFVRMKGPQGKGHAEMAVTKPKGYGAETPTSEPGLCAIDMWDSDWDEDPEDFYIYRHQRRLSDPSANLNNFVRGGWKTKTYEANGPGARTRSENDGLDSLANGLAEIEAGDVRDDCWSVGLVSPHPATSHCCCHSQCMGMQARSDKRCEQEAAPVSSEKILPQDILETNADRSFVSKAPQDVLETNTDSFLSNTNDSDEDEFHDCLSWNETDLEVGVDVGAASSTESDKSNISCPKVDPPTCRLLNTHSPLNKLKDSANLKAKWLNRQMPPRKVAPDGTTVHYWCDLPAKRPSFNDSSCELDDGAYNPLWTMRGFTQTFYFWKENKRAQSVPLNAFLTYITLPWWSIAKDILDHREEPILTF